MDQRDQATAEGKGKMVGAPCRRRLSLYTFWREAGRTNRIKSATVFRTKAASGTHAADARRSGVELERLTEIGAPPPLCQERQAGCHSWYHGGDGTTLPAVLHALVTPELLDGLSALADLAGTSVLNHMYVSPPSPVTKHHRSVIFRECH